MLARLQNYYSVHPLSFIMIAGFIFRFLSIVFSTGYGMHDDHFLVIEAAQSWVDGFDYNAWLPSNSLHEEPTGHSFFYVGLHFLFFKLCEIIGLDDPQVKMFLVRVIHGTWSMVTVYFGYKIVEKISNAENAKIVGMLLAVFWFFPILSVRNMVEMVCIPFMMISYWQLIKEGTNLKSFILAGLFMGLAIGVRMQIYLIFGGIGLVLLFEKKILGAIVFGISTLTALFVTQVTDLFLWGRPFAEMLQYVLYNSTHYEDYITQSWYQYILLIAGLLIPPISLLILFGYFRSWKKHLLFFLPVLIFLAFHSFYPNKQERFVLPIIPLLIISGTIGWLEFYQSSDFWSGRKGLYKGLLRFFWALNILALVIVSPASTKKSRVDAMYALRDCENVEGIILERTENYGCYLMPRYYHGDWQMKHLCYSKEELSKYKDEDFLAFLGRLHINYCLFIEEENIESRMASMKNYYPSMTTIAVVEPSYIDKILHFLNPRNQNEVVYICKLY